jgi:hypothetical protein
VVTRNFLIIAYEAKCIFVHVIKAYTYLFSHINFFLTFLSLVLGKTLTLIAIFSILSKFLLKIRSSMQCCGTVTIFYGSGSGSGSDF